jgi:hypothetical protein
MNLLILIFIRSIGYMSFDKTIETFDYRVGSESFKQQHKPIKQREDAISMLIN